MKLPRDIGGAELVKGLERLGYHQTRQRGDHVCMITQVNGEHHVTIPLHRPIRVGTLAAILASVTGHLQETREALLKRMKL